MLEKLKADARDIVLAAFAAFAASAVTVLLAINQGADISLPYLKAAGIAALYAGLRAAAGALAAKLAS